jgi:hypothetical protein
MGSQVKTIGAVKIAITRSWLDQQGKWTLGIHTTRWNLMRKDQTSTKLKMEREGKITSVHHIPMPKPE